MVFQAFGLDPDQTKSLLFWAVGFFAFYVFMQHLNKSPAQRPKEDAKKLTDFHTQWINKGFGLGYGDMNPAQHLPDLIQEFGTPSQLNPKSCGSAIWEKDVLQGTPFEKIEIRDEQIPHDIPSKHTDFLYSYYKIDIPSYKINGLKKISESISYDQSQKLMVARCHDMRPNVVSHWIVKQYADDQLTIDEAVGMYGPMIMELFNDDSDNHKYQQLVSEL